MKFYMLNEGICIRLKLFGEDIRELLLNNRWEETELEKANYIFINSCSFIESKEKQFIKIIQENKLIKKRNQTICVFGCLPSTNPTKIKKIDENAVLFKRDIDEIAEFFKLNMTGLKVAHVTHKKLSGFAQTLYWTNKIIIRDPTINYRLNKEKVFHLKISEGCLGNCAYCSEKFTTKLKSRKIVDIIKEFEEGLKLNYKIFSLNADDTSVFGKDNKEDIHGLLEKILKHPEDFMLTITEFNPQGLLDRRMFTLLKSKKIVFITVPVQSGSQRILDEMRRPYNIEKVTELLRKLKKMNSHIKINTHIIVGFPGETGEDFQKTLNLIGENLFDRVKIFVYNDRPGTESSLMEGKIPPEEKEKRANKLKRKVLYNCIKNSSLSNLLLNIRTML